MKIADIYISKLPQISLFCLSVFQSAHVLYVSVLSHTLANTCLGSIYVQLDDSIFLQEASLIRKLALIHLHRLQTGILYERELNMQSYFYQGHITLDFCIFYMSLFRPPNKNKTKQGNQKESVREAVHAITLPAHAYTSLAVERDLWSVIARRRCRGDDTSRQSS